MSNLVYMDIYLTNIFTTKKKKCSGFDSSVSYDDSHEDIMGFLFKYRLLPTFSSVGFCFTLEYMPLFLSLIFLESIPV